MNKKMIAKQMNNRPKSEHLELSKKGGEVRSPEKLLAARIRGLAWVKEENKQKSVDKIVNLLLSREFSGFNLLEYSEEIKNDPHIKTHQKIELLKTLTKIHDSLHGGPQVAQQFNFNPYPTDSIRADLMNKGWDTAKINKAIDERWDTAKIWLNDNMGSDEK